MLNICEEICRHFGGEVSERNRVEKKSFVVSARSTRKRLSFVPMRVAMFVIVKRFVGKESQRLDRCAFPSRAERKKAQKQP